MRYVVLVLSLALAAVGWGLWAQVHKNGELSVQVDTLTEAAKQAQEQREKDRKVLVARGLELGSKRAELKRAQEGLQKALQAHNDWSNTNVPTDVQKALQGPFAGPD